MKFSWRCLIRLHDKKRWRWLLDNWRCSRCGKKNFFDSWFPEDNK